MTNKKTKKAASPKVAVKKKAKKAGIKKAAPPKKALPLADEAGIPCICVKASGRWFCMKEEDGALIQCDGPFATKKECEEHTCL